MRYFGRTLLIVFHRVITSLDHFLPMLYLLNIDELKVVLLACTKISHLVFGLLSSLILWTVGAPLLSLFIVDLAGEHARLCASMLPLIVFLGRLSVKLLQFRTFILILIEGVHLVHVG